MEMHEVVSDVKCLVCVICHKTGAVISCCRDLRETGATFTPVTSHELREMGNTFLDKITARTL